MDMKRRWENGKQYLYLSAPLNEEGTYEERLFQLEEIESFLSLEIQCIDENREYMYFIEDYIALEDYIYHETLTVETMIGFFRAMLHAGTVLEEYLLNPKGILLYGETCFYDWDQQKWLFVYRNMDNKQWGEGVKRICQMFLAGIKEKGREANFLYELHGLCFKADMTMGHLRAFLNQYELAGRSAKIEKSEFCEKDEIISVSAQGKEQEKKTSDNILRHINYRHGICAVWVVIGIVIWIIAWKCNLFFTQVTYSLDWKKMISFFIFIVAGVGYGVWKTAPNKSDE